MSLSGVSNISAKSFVVSDVIEQYEDGSIVWIVNNDQEKTALAKNLELWTNKKVYSFNIKQNLTRDNQIERENNIDLNYTASQILEHTPQVFIFTYPDFMTALPDLDKFKNDKFELAVGQELSLVKLFELLINNGYDTASDAHIQAGEYFCQGNVVKIWPINSRCVYRVEVDFDQIVSIQELDVQQKAIQGDHKQLTVYPLLDPKAGNHFREIIGEQDLFIEDELGIIDDFFEEWNDLVTHIPARKLDLMSFAEDLPNHKHLHYTSVVAYHNPIDFVNDIKTKKETGWRFIIVTKHPEMVEPLLDEKHIANTQKYKEFEQDHNQILVIPFAPEDILPEGFQSGDHKIAFLSDKEIALTQKTKIANKNVYLDFLTSLKSNDLVVHADHGIARFAGLQQRTIDEITREYMQLNYAQNDKLFVPVDQAEKVSKYIGSEELAPKLTRLGSAEWGTITKRVKKETQEIAKELLKIYAARANAKGCKFKKDDDIQAKFEATFPYEETPGQIKAINDVKADMEDPKPMDRLVCGDVGFGKTEVAMRAAFKAVQSGKQVALISPITILTDQHFKSFNERMAPFHVRVEMLSRFRSPKEQREIIAKLDKGEIDIIIGTHRLLQDDIGFKNLGLVIIDEEQRFGVKQKEKLKKMRTEIDILTLTATPIPRTLNICLNKLRDITTITTPPPGRLPVITEVRRFSKTLIKEAIDREMDRGGQIYFLHNRVQTIESVAEKLRQLVPNARFVVAHGKLTPDELERRIMAFKKGEFDVLVSSTIIENGIDLSNANTLIVNKVEKFGLAQLYQLRGRVGRSKKQAYAYFLYHGQRLRLDAKKRLKAIVEASDLGAGFKIAMKDLEIRGAGDILGANQHGVINTVGVSHFMRMLNKAVEDLKTGRTIQEDQPKEVSIELPITAFIPDSFIVNTKDKISAYQKMSSADTFEYLGEIKEELMEEYGKPPIEVLNLFQVIELKIYAKHANVTNVKAENIHSATSKQIVLTMSDQMTPAHIMSLLEYNNKWIISGTKLKIAIGELGIKWMEELKVCLQKLSKAKKVDAKAS